MKNVILPVLFLLISNCCYSQDGYPRLIQYDKDTIVGITRAQMQALNLLYISYQEQVSINSVLTDQSKKCEAFVDKTDSLMVLHRFMMDIQNSRIADHKKTIGNLEVSVIGRDKQIRRMRLQRGVLGVLTTGLLATVVYMAMDK